eukprot:443723_1
MNDIISIDWEYVHLNSDLKPGCDGKGCYLGAKIHWQLTNKKINSNAQLIKIGTVEVSTWTFNAIQRYLDDFLNNDAPGQRLLVFNNNPSSINYNNNHISSQQNNSNNYQQNNNTNNMYQFHNMNDNNNANNNKFNYNEYK